MPIEMKWIDIDDKYKPEIGQEVLIRIPACDHFNIESAKYRGENQFLACWFDRRGDGCTYKVTHWMPLPEPPKE